MHPYPSKANCRFAYEVKVSRSDFLRDIKQPLKHRAALALSNCFYFVAPEGTIGLHELPIHAGLIEVMPARPMYLSRKVDAPWRDTRPPSWRFVVSLCRSVEKEAKGGGR